MREGELIYLCVSYDSVASEPAGGDWCVVLAPVFLEFLIADFGVLVLHERQAEESLLGGHFVNELIYIMRGNEVL